MCRHTSFRNVSFIEELYKSLKLLPEVNISQNTLFSQKISFQHVCININTSRVDYTLQRSVGEMPCSNELYKNTRVGTLDPACMGDVVLSEDASSDLTKVGVHKWP